MLQYSYLFLSVLDRLVVQVSGGGNRHPDYRGSVGKGATVQDQH